MPLCRDKTLEKIGPAKIALADTYWVIQNRKEMDWKWMRMDNRQDPLQQNVAQDRIEMGPVKPSA